MGCGAAGMLVGTTAASYDPRRTVRHRRHARVGRPGVLGALATPIGVGSADGMDPPTTATPGDGRTTVRSHDGEPGLLGSLDHFPARITGDHRTGHDHLALGGHPGHSRRARRRGDVQPRPAS